MKTFKTTMTLSLVTALSLVAINRASADRYAGHFNVNYDVVVQHAHDLEYVAAELKELYRDQFRYSPRYGKLLSRSAKIKNVAHRLHRFGTTRGSCQWNHEIQRLEQLIFELREYTRESIYRSRYDRPICNIALRDVRVLLNKAELHVAALKRAVRTANRPVYRQPAPNYAPPQFHTGYRNSGFYAHSNRHNRVDDRYRTNNRQPSNGFRFDLGALRSLLD